jgi:hypothetical protein
MAMLSMMLGDDLCFRSVSPTGRSDELVTSGHTCLDLCDCNVFISMAS